MYYPIMLNIEDKPCIIFGGGSVAARKARELLNCKGRLTVISPVLTEALHRLYINGSLKWIQDVYKESYIEGAILCFACTDDAAINGQIAEAAEKQGIFFNAADHNPMDGSFQSSFVVPAVRRIEDVTLAVSCQDNPAGSRYMAETLSGSIQSWMTDYIKKVREIRIHCRTRMTDSKTRQDFMKSLFSRRYLDLAEKSVEGAAFAALQELDRIAPSAGSGESLLKSEEQE